MSDFVKAMRQELFNNNRSLKWWYDNHVKPVIPNLKYSNFIRKINIHEEMTPELKKVIKDYLKTIES